MKQNSRLEDLPNLGKSIAADLRGLGILSPQQLSEHDAMEALEALGRAMGRRHAPGVLYTLLSVAHFQRTGEALPWWGFAARGKELLQSAPE